MSPIEYIIGGMILLLTVALVIVIGTQQSKRKSGLGNSIAGTGASETYLAKHNIGSKTSLAKKLTVIFAIIFVVLVVVLYIIGSVDEPAKDTSNSSGVTSGTVSDSSNTSNTSDSSNTSNTSVEGSNASDASAEASK